MSFSFANFFSRKPALLEITACSYINRSNVACIKPCTMLGTNSLKYCKLHFGKLFPSEAIRQALTANIALYDLKLEKELKSLQSLDERRTLCVATCAELKASKLEDEKKLKALKPDVVARPETAPKVKKEKIPQTRRLEVWNYHIGSAVGEILCPLCQNKRKMMQQGDGSSWHCSHVVPSSKGGGMEVSNLRAICASCNLAMGDDEMKDYCSKVEPLALKRLKLLCKCDFGEKCKNCQG